MNFLFRAYVLNQKTQPSERFPEIAMAVAGSFREAAEILEANLKDYTIIQMDILRKDDLASPGNQTFEALHVWTRIKPNA